MSEFQYLAEFLRFLLTQAVLITGFLAVFVMSRSNVQLRGRLYVLFGILFLFVENVGPIVATMILTMSSVDTLSRNDWVFRVLSLFGWIGSPLLIIGMVLAARGLIVSARSVRLAGTDRR